MADTFRDIGPAPEDVSLDAASGYAVGEGDQKAPHFEDLRKARHISQEFAHDFLADAGHIADVHEHLRKGKESRWVGDQNGLLKAEEPSRNRTLLHTDQVSGGGGLFHSKWAQLKPWKFWMIFARFFGLLR